MASYTQTKAIREKCLDCCGNRHEIELCPIVSCSLWAFRLRGKKPTGGKELEVLREKEADLERQKQSRLEKMTEKQKENVERWKKKQK